MMEAWRERARSIAAAAAFLSTPRLIPRFLFLSRYTASSSTIPALLALFCRLHLLLLLLSSVCCLLALPLDTATSSSPVLFERSRALETLVFFILRILWSLYSAPWLSIKVITDELRPREHAGRFSLLNSPSRAAARSSSSFFFFFHGTPGAWPISVARTPATKRRGVRGVKKN